MQFEPARKVAVRGLVVLSAAYLCAALVWRLVARPMAGLSLSKMDFEAALVALSSLGLVACAGWLALAATVVVFEAVLGVCVARSVCPLRLRRGLLLACGVAIGVGLSAPAVADAPGSAEPRTATARTGPVSGLAVPDRTTGSTPIPTEATPADVLVRAGDSLWALAARALPEGAGDAQVATTWRAIYAANATRIGTDPDLIFPGTMLRLPDTVTNKRKEL